MDRRHFLLASAAALAAPTLAAAEAYHVPYDPATFAAARDAGKAVLLDFYAPW